MKHDGIQKIKDEFESKLASAVSNEGLEAIRIEFFGRKGKAAGLTNQLESLNESQRKETGALFNAAKNEMRAKFDEKQALINNKSGAQAEKNEWIDVTLPGGYPMSGHLHLVSQAIVEIEDIFARIGFTRVTAPQIDWDWYAFESLNMPKDHPARDEWETYFVDAPEGKKGRVVLIPHTSNSQVRELEKGKLPTRMININRCYRRQSDVSHSPMFHQFEGFMVDKNVSIVHLKGILDHFAREFFGSERRTRLRPHHFPFTEPSFEVDITCGVCLGTGRSASGLCRLCKAGWLELGRAGMTHPNVLAFGGVNPKEYSALAFGWGIERTLMMRSGLSISDIRLLYRNDLHFVKQF